MYNFAHEMLHDSPSAARIMNLWEVRTSAWVRRELLSYLHKSESCITSVHYRNTKKDKQKRQNSWKVSLVVFLISKNKNIGLKAVSLADLDRFEMASQGNSISINNNPNSSEITVPEALEYERAHSIRLQPFFDSSLPNIRHPEVKSWADDLERERDELTEGKWFITLTISSHDSIDRVGL